MFLRRLTKTSAEKRSDNIKRLKSALEDADAVVIGAGAGLSTSAGLTYTGERFERYFSDFKKKYGIQDMYSGGFFPYPSLEEYWAWWSRHIYINRYTDAPNDTYNRLLELVKDKDYFVLTTNVDHCFQKAGFDKKRLFYTQGDYGLWQCSKACHQKTYDNEDAVRQMVTCQKDMGTSENPLYLAGGLEMVSVKERKCREPRDFQTLLTQTMTVYTPPDKCNGFFGDSHMKIPSELVPKCPVCGAPMTMNLRCDDSFVQDKGWYTAANRYDDFIRRHKNLNILFLELGVGANTPVIIKYPFWQMAARNPKAVYACINYGEAFCPKEIERQSICIDADIDYVLREL